MMLKLQVVNRINPDLLFPRVAAGVNHCLAIQSEGDKHGQPVTFQLWGWGSNEYQALGKPESIEQEIQPSPVKIYLEHKGKPYVPLQVSAGNSHSMVLACSQDYFQECFKNQQAAEKEVFSYDFGFKNLRFDDCVIFSSGSDEFGQQGRMTDKEQSQEEVEEGEQEDDEEEDFNEEEECFRMKGVVESITSVCQISCGANYTLALDVYGSIYSWGEGATGCLGLPVQVDQQRPTRVDFGKIRMKFVSAGPSHAASISEGSGSLYTWGVGTYGQLGHGTNKSSNVPNCIEIGSIVGKVVEFVSCGALHTACTTTDGYAHTFGFNKNGQLGTGDYNDRWEPFKVHSIQNFYAVYTKCGGNTTFITTLERLTFAFGSNSKGRLGIKDEDGANYPEPHKIDTNYFKSKQQFIYQFALSYHYGLALLQSGTIISFGLPFKGILGRDLQAELLPNNQIANMSMNDDFKYDDDEGEELNQNKLNEVLNSIKPDLLTSLIEPKNVSEDFYFFGMHCTDFINKLQKEIKASSSIVDVKCGAFHTAALTDAGEVWVWGSNKCLQHGLKDEQIVEQIKSRTKFIGPFVQETMADTSYPSQVLTFSIRENKRVTYLATGLEYIVVVENRRNIYSWGKNDKGQLGLGFVSDFVEVPSMMTDLEGFMVKQVACGEDHTLILDEGGSLYAVGSPADGKLGLGPKNSVVLQTQRVPFIIDVARVAVGPHHSMALVVDKKYNERVIRTKANEKSLDDSSLKYVIYTWGNGYGGKLGHGNLDNQYYPKILQTKYSFKDISAGTNHSGALTIDEQVVVWGVGSYLGLTKPEDESDDKQHLKSDKDQEVEPYYIVSPIKHSDYCAPKKYKNICLGDRYNMVINRAGKVQVWGLFDFEFQKKMKECQNPAQREKYVEVIMNNISNLPLTDIQFSVVNCSFSHAVALTDNTEKRELFSWGFDGMTGRLGLGYEFINPEKENEMQLQNKAQQPVKRETFTTLNQMFEKPQPLQFINQYLEYSFKQYQLLQLQAEKQDDDDQGFDDEIKKKDYKKNVSDAEGIQLTGKQTQRKSKRVYIGVNLGIVEQGKLMYKQSWEQFINESKPDIYRCAYVERNEDGERVANSKKVNFFEEKPVDDVYEAVLELDQENQKLYEEIKNVYLQEFKQFKDEAMLTIINKIQREPFKIEFATAEPDKDKKKEKQKEKEKHSQTKKHEAYRSCSLCYKIMFTMLQLHPCYLINIYQSGGLTKKNFVDLVMDTYGDVQSDKRKYRLFINLIIKILKIDLLKAEKKLMFSINEDSPLYTFTNLFIQFSGQFGQSISNNLKFIEATIKAIETKLTSGIAKNLKPIALVFSQNQLENPGCDLVIQKVEGPQQNKFFQERLEFIKQFWDDFGQKFTQHVQQDVSAAVRELFLKTYDIVKPFFQKQSQQVEQIQCRMIGLYFMNYQKMFMDMMDKQESEKTRDQRQESNYLNVKCFLEMFNYYINDLETEPENVPWWQTIVEIFVAHASRRVTGFNAIAYGALTNNGLVSNKLPEKIQSVSKFTSHNEVNKIKDIYMHCLEYQDDIIIPRVKSIYWATKSIVDNINKIKYVQAENQDMMEQFAKNIKSQPVSYLTEPEPDASTGNERIQVKLKTRQLFYTTKSLQLRHCHSCGSFGIESFLSTEDHPPFQRFDQWNPVSLSALLINIVGCFKNKKEFDDFLAGQNQDVSNYISKKANQQQEQGLFGNIIKLKEFDRAFNEKVQFNIEQSDDVVDDKKQVKLRENKKVLRELRMQIQDRLISIYKYLYNMEKNMATLDVINQVLKEKIEKFKTEKVGLYNRIISNCYFGMANKELIKPLESNPVAMVGQIRDAIKQVSTSIEIYENIDVFKRSADQPSFLSIFGNYSFNILKSRSVIDSIKPQAYEEIRKHTRQIVSNAVIESRVVFSFQKDTNSNNLEIVIIYSEVEFDLKQTVSCGLIQPLIEPIEYIVDQFIVGTSKILQMRKDIALAMNVEKPEQLGKFSMFKKKGLMQLLDELTNHAVIYDHLYVEPEKKEGHHHHQQTK